MLRKTTLRTIRRLIHPSQKVKQIQCVVTPSRCKEGLPFHCVYVQTTPASGFFTVCYPSQSLLAHVLTAMLYRPHRVAPGGRPRCDSDRSATGDATACPERTSSAYDARAAVPRAEFSRLRQRGGSCVRDRFIRPTDGPDPAEQRLARKGHNCDDRLRAHGSDRHTHRHVVCDRRRLERRRGRTGSPRCSSGQADARAAVWSPEA